MALINPKMAMMISSTCIHIEPIMINELKNIEMEKNKRILIFCK